MNKSKIKIPKELKITIIEDIIQKAQKIRADNLKNICLAKDIDPCRESIPKPYIGDKEIKLIIIGQDPTVSNIKRRDEINTALDLDNNKGVLYNYISLKIVDKLGLTMDNVYATNLYKYFFKDPPVKNDIILYNHFPSNVELLKYELSLFSDAKIITLGEPILKLLVKASPMNDKHCNEIKYYWGKYNNQLTFCSYNNNHLLRDFFPFPHINSYSRSFYKNNFDKYIDFVKKIEKVL